MGYEGSIAGERSVHRDVWTIVFFDKCSIQSFKFNISPFFVGFVIQSDLSNTFHVFLCLLVSDMYDFFASFVLFTSFC